MKRKGVIYIIDESWVSQCIKIGDVNVTVNPEQNSVCEILK